MAGNRIITMEAFSQTIKAALQSAYPDCKVETKDILKDNSLHLTGLTISDGDSHIPPVIELDPFYEDYIKGHSLLEISIAIATLYEQNSSYGGFPTEMLADYQLAQKHICYRLVNRAKNRKKLEAIPYMPYLDLAIIFYIPVSIKNGRADCLTINRPLLKEWGITDVNELYENAHKNTCRILRGRIDSMMDVAVEALYKKEIQPADIKRLIRAEQASKDNRPMYVASNNKRLYGTAVILYDGILKSLAGAIGDDLIILPSSIHETLLLPASTAGDLDFLREMVSSVNKTIDTKEVLSDSIYYYDQQIDRVKLI